MEWLNYHHLFYFWTVVRLGSITKACEELRLAPPTVSAQLRSLEDQLGEKLLKRSGRNLVPTEIGLAVYRQAEEIFSIGREIMDTVKQRPTHRPLRLVVGLDDVVQDRRGVIRFSGNSEPQYARLQSLPGRLRRRMDGAATLGEALPQGVSEVAERRTRFASYR